MHTQIQRHITNEANARDQLLKLLFLQAFVSLNDLGVDIEQFNKRTLGGIQFQGSSSSS